MISCTEFIPAYSEVFKFIDDKSGRQAVYDFWKNLFQPENSPLDGLITQYGRLPGCWKNWYTVYTEEACDNTMLYNEQEGWLLGCMHHCPSKGRFQKLGYMEPFDEYCRHCDSYDIVFQKHGIGHRIDYRGSDQAKCREIIFDPDKFQGDPQGMLDVMYQCEMEGCRFGENPSQCPMNRPGTKALHTTADAYKYLHRDFHISMALCLQYVTDHYGETGLQEYLTRFVRAFHGPLLARIREKGLNAIADYLIGLYTEEEAEDALEVVRGDTTLDVFVHYCPALRHFQTRSFVPQKSFALTKEILYTLLAVESGLGFRMYNHNPQSGATHFCFWTQNRESRKVDIIERAG